MNLIFGVAGFAREVDWLLYDLQRLSGIDYRTEYFVAEDSNELIGTMLNSCPVISESEAFKRFGPMDVNCFVAVGSPEIKEKIVTKIRRELTKCRFPSLIHPSVSYDNRPGKVVVGEGTFICAKCVLTTDISLGNFVHINLDCTIGHDTIVGDFTTVSPGVHISGNVSITDHVFIGTGAVLVERISVCANTFLGACSMLTKDIEIPGVYVGAPARKAK